MRPMIEIGPAADRRDPSLRIPHRNMCACAACPFVGSILVFRMAHAAVLAQMEWDAIGPRQENRHCAACAAELVAALGPVKGGAA